jgi:hypothetical protein
MAMQTPLIVKSLEESIPHVNVQATQIVCHRIRLHIVSEIQSRKVHKIKRAKSPACD